MLYNLKHIFRNLIRNRFYSAINIFGLAVGMAVIGFIALWLYGVLTFDAFHNNAKDTYLVAYTMKRSDGAETTFDATSYGLVHVLEQIPAVRNIASVISSNDFASVRVNDQFYSLRSVLVSSDWFTVFDYTLLDGSLENFGGNPFCAAFTSSEAQRLFGTEKAVGKVFIIGERPFTVQAVIKDNPKNSSFVYDAIFPIEAQRIDPSWELHKNDPNWFRPSIFVLLSKNADKENITQSIDRYYFQERNMETASWLLPLKNMYFDDQISQPAFARGDPKTIYLLSILAILLLVVACLN